MRPTLNVQPTAGGRASPGLHAATAAAPVSLRARLDGVPHRAFFLAGVLAALSQGLWWALVWLLAPQQAYAAVPVHGLMTPLAVFPLFMQGFVFTAGPRWLNVADGTPRQGNLLQAALALAGIWLALGGFMLGGAWPLPGLLLMAAQWGGSCWRWASICRRSQVADRQHGVAVLLAMLGGLAAMLAACGWVASGNDAWWGVARQALFWCFLLPVFLTVSHRMLPFFTQAALLGHTPWRPARLLHGWLASCVLLAAAKLAGWHAVEAVLALLLAASLAYTSARWGLYASLQNRLLAMLHFSFVWLVPALLLQVAAALGWPVGAAPVHALGLGFAGTMLMAFVTRVSLGHSGRPLQADNGFVALYVLLHVVALWRVGLAIAGSHAAWLALASLAWLAVLLAWAARVVPMYLQPRQDGKAG